MLLMVGCFRKPIKDMGISPEEEERRRVRRERNKAAAARCRKRRVDHTNSLIKVVNSLPPSQFILNKCFVFQEVEDLEQKRQKLIDEQVQLKQLKQQLEYLLESHVNSDECRRITSSPPDVKPFDHMYYDKALERVKTESIDTLDHNVFLLPSPKKVSVSFFRVFNRK